MFKCLAFQLFQKYVLFKSWTFKHIVIVCLFVWPVFGGRIFLGIILYSCVRLCSVLYDILYQSECLGHVPLFGGMQRHRVGAKKHCYQVTRESLQNAAWRMPESISIH